MLQLRNYIRNIMFFIVGASLFTICWLFFLDGTSTNDWRNFEITTSIVACIAVYSILHFVIMYFVPFNFLIEKILECIMAIVLWFVFGYFFRWYNADNWYYVFIYILPVYTIMYLWDLYSLKKDVAFVNQKIKKNKCNS